MLPSRMLHATFNRKQFLFLVAFLTVINNCCLGLKDVKVSIPQAASIGDTVTLQCLYDLEGEPLYTIKWYKGSHEIYRYVPKEMPSQRIFPYQGIDVNLDKSDDKVVALRNLQADHSGKYKCEVSTDIPNFYTHMQTGYMYVINAPKGDPQITFVNSTYDTGDTLRMKCTSPLSYPAINLTWYINGKKVNSSFQLQLPDPNSDGKRKPVTTVIGLEHEIHPSLYEGGKAIMVKCAGDLFHLYNRVHVQPVEQEKPKPRPSSVKDSRDSSVSGLHGGSPCSLLLVLATNILLQLLITR